MLDFSNSKTVVWDTTCVYTPENTSCGLAPVQVQPLFTSQSNNSANFTNQTFGGYQCDGKVYESTLCIDSNCKIIEVYSAINMTADYWLYNMATTYYLSYGILGYGPESSFWNQYIDIDTGVAEYSIALAENLLDSSIILGGTLSSNYAN